MSVDCSACNHCRTIRNPSGTVLAECGRASGGLFCDSCRCFSTLLEWTESGRQANPSRFVPTCPNCGKQTPSSAFHETDWRSGHLGAFQPADIIPRPAWCPADWFEPAPEPVPEVKPKPKRRRDSAPTLF